MYFSVHSLTQPPKLVSEFVQKILGGRPDYPKIRQIDPPPGSAGILLLSWLHIIPELRKLVPRTKSIADKMIAAEEDERAGRRLK